MSIVYTYKFKFWLSLKLNIIPTFRKNYLKTFWKVLTNTYLIQYNKIFFMRITTNYISSQNIGVRLCTVHVCGMRKGNTAAAIAALNCRRRSSVKDSFDFEFQSQLHHCETKTARDKTIVTVRRQG